MYSYFLSFRGLLRFTKAHSWFPLLWHTPGIRCPYSVVILYALNRHLEKK